MKHKFWVPVVIIIIASLVAGCGPTPAPAQPTPRPGEGTAPLPDAARARDAVLTYLQDTGTEAAPAASLSWAEEDASPEGLVGSSSVVYRAPAESGEWVITVTYPIVAPEHTVYSVVAENEATGFQWQGEVSATGEVISAQATPPAPADPADITKLADGNTAFALELYQLLRQQEGNLFYSPYSISLALAMTYAGARGETEVQMAEALHFDLPQDRLHPAFEALAQVLASRGEVAEDKEGEGFRLNVANALWGQEDYQFLATFLAVVEQHYGGGLQPVDFLSAPEEARETINAWVEDETEGKIQDLIPSGVIDSLTRLVLTNAIYFNAAWADPFEPDMTKNGPFYLLDGGEVSVPMMRQMISLPYYAGDGYQAVEMFYDGHELSMVILLPEQSALKAFEGSLDRDQLAAIVQNLEHQPVSLTMPRFEFDAEFSLKEALATLGMPQAFTEAADFSGMTGNRDLLISEVVHKAFVAVDEAGTEAAAATAVEMAVTGAPAEPVQVTLDHPFLFLIRDIETGTILFLGRVVDPSS
ncbi:MAG: serpin family protein [Anaerolineae bacterium]|nr:serpin family protein [Anaerolineae bacterium]